MSDQAPMGTPTGRRRSSAVGRRFSVVDVLAVAMPLLTMGALALTSGPLPAALPVQPDLVPLQRSTLVCPPGPGHVRVASADPTAAGEVELRDPAAQIALSDGRAVSVEALRGSSAQVVVVGSGALAPGLLAARVDGDIATCLEPNPTYFFAGVGAGPEHASTLHLVNPDGGTAIADVTVFGPDGVLDVPSLRGVAVRGGKTLPLDLSAIVPSLDSLGLQVSVTRGRLGAFVRDQYDPLGRGATRQTAMAAQLDPSTDLYLAGVRPGQASQQLTVLNPADSEAVVTLKVVSRRAEFASTALKPLRVPARSTSVLDVSRALRGPAAAQVVGLRLEATHPVAATLQRRADDSWQIAPAVSTLTSRGATLLPRGEQRQLLLQAVSRTGVAVIETRDRAGRVLGTQRQQSTPGVATVTALPARAATLSVTLERTSAMGAVLTPDAVVPVRELRLLTAQPRVSPALF